MKYRRSSDIIVANEARVLKQLRIAAGFSMRQAGALVSKSDTYICHIETGRMDVPKGERLEQLLGIYGGIKIKSFNERVRLYRHQLTGRQEVMDLVNRLPDYTLPSAICILKGLLSMRQPEVAAQIEQANPQYSKF